MRNAFLVIVLLVSLGALFFLLLAPPRVISLFGNVLGVATDTISGAVPPLTITSGSTTSSVVSTTIARGVTDIEYQKSLPNPPAIVKGIYATGWSAGSVNKMKYLTGLIDRTELNAIVIDIKDYSGFVSYHTGVPEVSASGAEKEIRIAKPNTVIKELHDKGIYVIGRVSVFQDPVLAKAHPEWALQDITTSSTWKDSKGLAWMDPASENVWAYDVSIARDALARGFDEINFDYVRFASDGALAHIRFPAWDGVTPKHEIIKKFFTYVRGELPGARISADLFGLATVNPDDLGIGQVIEDGYQNFDFISPMVYPSHYAGGFLGYKNPASFPYEIIQYSIQTALSRLQGEWPRLVTPVANTSTPQASGTVVNATTSPSSPVYHAGLRPWLQDFNLGATYNAEMVRKEIQATEEVLSTAHSSSSFAGWLLWNASNVYTEAALRKE